MSSIITQNRNRAHAIKQLQRGLKKASHIEEHIEDGAGEIQLLGSIANSLIYIGDILKDMNDSSKHSDDRLEMKNLFDNTDSTHESDFDDDEIPF